MAFCGTCGAPVEGRFCAKCGASVLSGAGPAATPPPAGGPPVASGAPLADNVVAALCYAFTIVTGIIFLLLAPYNRNRNIRFHAFQAIFLFVAAFVIRIALGLVFVIIGGLGVFSGLGVWTLVNLAFFALWVYLIVTAYQGRTVVLPVIGDLAQRQA